MLQHPYQINSAWENSANFPQEVFSPIPPSMASKNLSFSSCGSNVVRHNRKLLRGSPDRNRSSQIHVFKGNPYAKKFWNRTILFGSCVKITYDHLLMRKTYKKCITWLWITSLFPLVFPTIPKRTTRTHCLHCCDVWQLQGIVFSQNLIERQLHLGFTSLLSAKCQSEKYRALPLSNRHP